MFEYIEELIQEHANGGVLVDTNLLILLLVGQTRPELIGQYAHTKEYSVEDFQLLSRLVERFRFIRTTPHILTEVSNLSGKLQGKVLQEFRQHFSISVSKFEERTCRDSLVLTADFPLANVLEHLGVHVINFSNIRPLGW
jgi:hypothetical protein